MINTIAQNIIYTNHPPVQKGNYVSLLKTGEFSIGVAITIIGVLGLVSIFSFHPALAYSLTGLGGVWTVGNLVSVVFRQSETIKKERIIPIKQDCRAIKERVIPINQDCGVIFERAAAYIEANIKEEETRQVFLRDFQTVLGRGESDAYAQMERMLEALPYYLGLKVYTESEFRPIGITNHWGRDCFLNAALQCLVHTRFADYLLFRPLPDDPPPPKEAPEQPVLKEIPLKPDFDLCAYDGKKLRLIVREYNEEYEANTQYNNDVTRTYNQAIHAYRAEQVGYRQKLEALQKMRVDQKNILSLVQKLRRGEALTRGDKKDFETECRQGGGHHYILNKVAALAPIIGGQQQILFGAGGCLQKDLENGILDNPWSLLILGSGNHYKVLVRYKGKMYEIDDSAVRQVNRSNQEIFESRRKFQPYFPGLHHSDVD